MPELVSFDRVGGHLDQVPVRVGGTVASSFLLDTGIGLTTLSLDLAEKVGCRPNGATYRGKRMSGQELDIPLGTVSALRFGSVERRDFPVGIFDLRGMLPQFPRVEGFLAPGFFAGGGFTINPVRRGITIEDSYSIDRRVRAGHSIPLEVVVDGPSMSLFVRLQLPGRYEARVEVDTGSNDLILNLPYMRALGLGVGSVRTVEGTDETGQPYTRYGGRIPGPVSFSGVPTVVHQAVDAIFQEIIYDGLLGTSILDHYSATFDLAGGHLILGRPD